MKRLTNEEFINKCKLVHEDKYCYDKVVYVNMHTPVCIICPIHGEFYQDAQSHIRGCGCPFCSHSKAENNLVCGVGVNDLGAKLCQGGNIPIQYRTWLNILKRCYKQTNNEITYLDCSVCEEWLTLSNFKKWFDNPSNGYMDGYQIDKDILVKNNKVYSPQTCCFVPHEINMLLVKRNAKRGNYPIGVSKISKRNKFESHLSKMGAGTRRLGIFDTAKEAFLAYKQAKEAHIKEVAQKYYDESKITKRVYDALMKYEVEITD